MPTDTNTQRLLPIVGSEFRWRPYAQRYRWVTVMHDVDEDAVHTIREIYGDEVRTSDGEWLALRYLHEAVELLTGREMPAVGDIVEWDGGHGIGRVTSHDPDTWPYITVEVSPFRFDRIRATSVQPSERTLPWEPIEPLQPGQVFTTPSWFPANARWVVQEFVDNGNRTPYLWVRNLDNSSQRMQEFHPTVFTLLDETAPIDFCDDCGDESSHRLEDLYTTADVLRLCAECRDARDTCYFCSNIIGDNSGVEDAWVDGEARTICGNCDEHHWCDDCEEHHYGNPMDWHQGARQVHSWNFRPAMQFHPERVEGQLYIGMELETEYKNADAMQVNETLNVALGEGSLGYLKNDGSLSYGVEIVSMPMTPEFFLANYPFDAIKKVKELGCRSFDANTCGIHLHVSRDAFSDTHLWRFLQFHYRNPTFCQTIAQRPSTTYATWEENDGERLATISYVKKKNTNPNRYVAVNLQNEHTIELRYFKGTLNADAIRKNIQFVWALYDYTRDMSLGDVAAGALSTRAFVGWLHSDENRARFPQLLDFVDAKVDPDAERFQPQLRLRQPDLPPPSGYAPPPNWMSYQEWYEDCELSYCCRDCERINRQSYNNYVDSERRLAQQTPLRPRSRARARIFETA